MFFSPLILQPTRVTEKSKNIIIDNIVFNNFEFTTIPGNITHSISEHLIQFVILEYYIKPSSPCISNNYERNFKNFANNKLKEDFNKTGWGKVIYENGNSVNDAFQKQPFVDVLLNRCS